MPRKESFGKFQEQDQCSGFDPGVCESIECPGILIIAQTADVNMVKIFWNQVGKKNTS